MTNHPDDINSAADRDIDRVSQPSDGGDFTLRPSANENGIPVWDAGGQPAPDPKESADEQSTEFWDAIEQAVAPPSQRAMWMLVGALGVCAVLITSAAAFATAYFL